MKIKSCFFGAVLAFASLPYAAWAQALPDNPQPTQPTLPAPVTIPKDTEIELVALEKVSSETATNRSHLRFVVAKDVVVDRITVVSAGTPVKGIVTKVKRGIPYHQGAELRIHMEDVRIDRNLRLRLSQWPPEARQGDWKDVATYIAFPTLYIALKHLQDDGWGEDGPPKPDAESGQQAVLPACVSFDFWVTFAKTIAATDLPLDKAGSTTPLNVACPQLRERPWIYGSPELYRVLFR